MNDTIDWAMWEVREDGKAVYARTSVGEIGATGIRLPFRPKPALLHKPIGHWFSPDDYGRGIHAGFIFYDGEHDAVWFPQPWRTPVTILVAFER